MGIALRLALLWKTRYLKEFDVLTRTGLFCRFEERAEEVPEFRWFIIVQVRVVIRVILRVILRVIPRDILRHEVSIILRPGVTILTPV